MRQLTRSAPPGRWGLRPLRLRQRPWRRCCWRRSSAPIHPLDELCVVDDTGQMTDVLLDGRVNLIRVAEDLLVQWPKKSAHED
jgi:hypothetical protein